MTDMWLRRYHVQLVPTAAMVQLTLYQREKIAELRSKGYTIGAIARELSCHKNTVRRWCAIEPGQQDNFKNAPGQGRKRKLSATEVATVKKKARNFHTVNTITASINRKRGDPVSRYTVDRALHSGRHPLEYGPIRHGRRLRDSNKKARLQFCRDFAEADFTKWVFVDSKYLYLFHDSAGHLRFAWRNEGESIMLPSVSNPYVYHFYSAVAKGHKADLVFVPPTAPLTNKAHKSKVTFKGNHYQLAIAALNKQVAQWFPHGNYVIIRDKAKQHTSKSSNNFVREHNIPILDAFPAQSWDINIIELCWGQLTAGLQGCKASTKRGLRDAVKEAWARVKQATINQLVEGVPTRLAQIASKGGDWLASYHEKQG
jgi:transposase